jgi:hypothetical protein
LPSRVKTQQPTQCPLCRADFETRGYFEPTGMAIEESEEWQRIKREARQRLEEERQSMG